jgi:hypothetical protein
MLKFKLQSTLCKTLNTACKGARSRPVQNKPLRHWHNLHVEQTQADCNSNPCVNFATVHNLKSN